MHCLYFTDTDLYSLTKGKSYLAKQKWRLSVCLRDQCYDVGCHPWHCYHTKLHVLTAKASSWVQTVCMDYQETTLAGRVNKPLDLK